MMGNLATTLGVRVVRSDSNRNHPSDMNPNRVGTLSEKRAICYFVEQGLDVFDSCQDTGPVDMITFNPITGETKCWEVKSENFRLTGPKKGTRIGRNRRNIKFTKIIHMIYVDKNGTIREGTRK